MDSSLEKRKNIYGPLRSVSFNAVLQNSTILMRLWLRLLAEKIMLFRILLSHKKCKIQKLIHSGFRNENDSAPFGPTTLL
jgi:hypothetical protein